MSLHFKNQIIKNQSGQIKYKVFHEGGKEHYHIGVWVEGDDNELDSIQRVEYLLHPTFKRPLRSFESRDNKFSVTFWTWGMFMIRVSIFFKNGIIEKRDYYLGYELPEDNGSNYSRE